MSNEYRLPSEAGNDTNKFAMEVLFRDMSLRESATERLPVTVTSGKFE